MSPTGTDVLAQNTAFIMPVFQLKMHVWSGRQCAEEKSVLKQPWILSCVTSKFHISSFKVFWGRIRPGAQPFPEPRDLSREIYNLKSLNRTQHVCKSSGRAFSPVADTCVHL